MPDKIRELECPSCGASIQFDSESTRCEFCGASLERLRPEIEAQRAQAHSISIELPAEAMRPGRRVSSVGGCLIAVILLVVIGGAVAVFAFSSLAVTSTVSTVLEEFPGVDVPVQLPEELAQLAPERNWTLSNGPYLLLERGDNLPLELVAYVTVSSTESDHIVYVEGDTLAERWRSEALLAESYQTELAADASNVYVADGTGLIAFMRDDGSEAWRTTMGDVLSSPCDTCLQAIGDRVMALTTAGSLEAYETNSGRLAWSKRLTETPRQLVVAGRHIGVLDRDDNGVSLFLFNPADGVQVGRLDPRCPNEPFPNDPQEPGIYDTVFADSGGRSLYFTAGFFDPGCLQRWDPASGARLWEATFDVDALRYPVEALVANEAFYLGNDFGVIAVSTAEGAVSQWEIDADYEFRPLAADGVTLVALARRTRGSEQFALWGLDATSGTRRWQYVLQADELSSSTSVVHDGDAGIWSYRLTPAGFVVVQALANPYRVAFELLDMATGESIRQQTVPVESSTSFWFDVIAWDDDQVWLEIASDLRVINLTESTGSGQ